MPFYQKEKSKIKMVALMPHNVQNITWYSPVDQNKKPSQTIVNGMLRRFQSKPEAKKVVVIQFYEEGKLFFELK